MAFKEYREPNKTSKIHEFNVERFSYDVFAYMLRICGFPEEKIPISSFNENIYGEDDFVMNVGLSALPIALYKRDEWKFAFEELFAENVINNILEIQNYLEFCILYSGELEEEDTVSKIQFSLALYSEYTLFLNFKNIETYFDTLPKLWSNLHKELVAQSCDFDQTLESSLTMCPDVSESWLSSFISDFAIPYGSLNDVSVRFSIHTLEIHEDNDTFPDEISTDGVTDAVPEKSAQPTDIAAGDTLNFSPKGSNLELNYIPDGECSTVYSGLRLTSEENTLFEARAHKRRRNGLTYVLQQCLKGRKRSRSQKLEVEDAFGKINLEKENISPENCNIKRRRKISGKEALE